MMLPSSMFTLQFTELTGNGAIPRGSPLLMNLSLTHRRMLIKYTSKMTTKIREWHVRSDTICNVNWKIVHVDHVDATNKLVLYRPCQLWNSKLAMKSSVVGSEVVTSTGGMDQIVRVTVKVQNVSECLSRWYFLNHRRFCYQIWYGDAASWARGMQNFCCCCCYLQGQRQ